MEEAPEGKGALSMLLVEDEEIARSSLGRMLALKFPGVRIHTADNGLSGLQLYREHRPEVVITDINMPQSNGIEMAGRIRSESPQAQIIFLSAHSEMSYLINARNLGIPHYVMKPVDRHELFALVEGCLQAVRAGSV